jgi:hypothetical protein
VIDMARMTEEEAWALDEELTNAGITLKKGAGGFLTRNWEQEILASLDELSAAYLRSQAESTKKPVTELIGILVRHELASAS